MSKNEIDKFQGVSGHYLENFLYISELIRTNLYNKQVSGHRLNPRKSYHRRTIHSNVSFDGDYVTRLHEALRRC